MAWINTISPDEATGELKRYYEEAKKRAGRVFNILRVQSLNPPVLAASTRLYVTLMHGPGSLTRGEREMLATVTSWANDCFY